MYVMSKLDFLDCMQVNQNVSEFATEDELVNTTRCSAIAERPRCSVRYSFR